jgi:predicted phosphate transport protein (TIGR00153 family)
MFRIGRKKDEFQDLLKALAAEISGAVDSLKKMIPGASDLGELEATIKQHERRGDELIHDLITKLNRSFITPFDREDLHGLSELMDDVLDLIHACAFKMYFYGVDRPITQFEELVAILERQVQLTSEAIADLYKPDRVLALCSQIDDLENQADHVHHNMIRTMFETERDPIRLIKNKEVIEDLEAATDACEDVADALESVVVKYA